MKQYTRKELLSLSIAMVLKVEFVKDYHMAIGIEKMEISNLNLFKDEIDNKHEDYRDSDDSYPFLSCLNNYYGLLEEYGNSNYYGDVRKWLNEYSYVDYCLRLLDIEIIPNGSVLDNYWVLVRNDGSLKGFISEAVAKSKIDENTRDLLYGDFSTIKKYGYKINKMEWKNITKPKG